MKRPTPEEMKAEWQAEHDAGETRLTYMEWAARRIMEQAREQATKPVEKSNGVTITSAPVEKKQPVDKSVSSQKGKNSGKGGRSKPGQEDKALDDKEKPTGGARRGKGNQEITPQKATEKPAPQDGEDAGENPERPAPQQRIVTEDSGLPDAPPPQLDDVQVLCSGMTAKQEMFCREWVIDRNGTQAAIRAGYSEATAGAAASRLLKNVKVRAFIEALVAPHLANLEITQEWILREYKAMASVNNYDFVKKDEAGLVMTDENGLPIPDFTAVTRAQMAGLAGMEIVILPAIGEDDPNPIKVKWKIGDKKAALDVLAKRSGLLKEQIDVTGEIKIKGDNADLARRIAFMLRKAGAHDKKDR